MTDFKLSELPENTVIEVEDTQYIKQGRDYGNEKSTVLWLPLSCEDCCATLSYTEEHAEEKFTDFKILSLPWGVVANLAMSLQEEYGYVDAEGEDITVRGLIQGAIDAHTEFLKLQKVEEK